MFGKNIADRIYEKLNNSKGGYSLLTPSEVNYLNKILAEASDKEKQCVK